MGCAGHSALKTPHIDSLAAQGIRFTNAFTNCPLCVPARMALALGRYPHNTGLWTNDVTLPTGAPTYFKLLQASRYHTATIGKNHLFPMENCDLYANIPYYRETGFHDVEDLSGTWGVIKGKSKYTDYLHSNGWLKPLAEYLRHLEEMPDEKRRYIAESLPIPAEAYIDAYVARRVEHYVQHYDRNEPSFLFVGFQGPHEPWDAPQEYTDLIHDADLPSRIDELPQGDWLPQSSRNYHRWAQYYPPPTTQAWRAIVKRYYGKIAQIDDAVGRILDAYERKGWLDNTVIIFASDHGEMLGDHNRLSKSVFYDSAIRIPLIIRVPGVPSRVCDQFVEIIDLHQTILDLAGCPREDYCDSLSLWPLISARSDRHRDSILGEVHAHLMLRTHDSKIVVGRDGKTLVVFDLEHDPQEQKNLFGHPESHVRELELRSLLLERLALSQHRLGVIDVEYCGHAMPAIV